MHANKHLNSENWALK